MIRLITKSNRKLEINKFRSWEKLTNRMQPSSSFYNNFYLNNDMKKNIGIKYGAKILSSTFIISSTFANYWSFSFILNITKSIQIDFTLAIPTYQPSPIHVISTSYFKQFNVMLQFSLILKNMKSIKHKIGYIKEVVSFEFKIDIVLSNEKFNH